jgi:hypothetical protein
MRELCELSERSTPGEWSVSGIRARCDEPSCAYVDAGSCRGLLALPTAGGKAALGALADARFIVALVNAFRAGRLALAAQEGGRDV